MSVNEINRYESCYDSLMDFILSFFDEEGNCLLPDDDYLECAIGFERFTLYNEHHVFKNGGGNALIIQGLNNGSYLIKSDAIQYVYHKNGDGD